MFTKKTRVIIATILLITALALALRGRIIWEEITQWIAVQSLPLITSQNEPLAQPEKLPEQQSPSSMHDTSEVIAPSSATIPSEEPQIIPNPEIIETVLQQIKTDAETKKPRVARRRRKKETAPVFAITPVVITEEKQSEPATAIQPVSTIVTTESVTTKASDIGNEPSVVLKKTIHICNKIDANKLGVKHWTGTYSPTKLEITLNNVPFIIVGDNPTALETLQEIPCTDNRITVCYLYEFLNGMRKGSDTVLYTFTDATQLEMHFSWDTPWHVELSAFGEPLRRDTTP